MMPVIGKQEVSCVPSAKSGKHVPVLEESCKKDKHVLIAGTGKFLHHILF